MNNDPMVVSIADDYRRYPRSTWGTRHRVRAAREDRARAEAARLTKGLPSSWQAYVPGPQHELGRFELHPPRRPRPETARGRRIDKILDELGVRPRGQGR